MGSGIVSVIKNKKNEVPRMSKLMAASLLLLPLPAMGNAYDAALTQYFKPGGPGAVVLVAKDGKTVFRKAYGMADMEKNIVLDPSAQLRIGSITKQFTAVAIMMLAEEGRLSLDDDIAKHLPAFPTHGKRITIEHLLTHTGGVPNFTGKPGFVPNMAKEVTVAGMIDSFKNDPLQSEPGTKFAYTNSGYFLLGAIIEKVSGMPYARFLEQRIFIPLGMLDTAQDGHANGKAKRAVGYTSGGPGFEPAPPIAMTQIYAAGALVSTVDDLARWDAAISSGKLLKSANWQRAFTPYKLANGSSTGYGYGWGTSKVQGSPTIEHGGGINGFTSFAMRLPKEKVFVVVLSNTDNGITAPEVVAARAAAIAIGKPYPASFSKRP